MPDGYIYFAPTMSVAVDFQESKLSKHNSDKMIAAVPDEMTTAIDLLPKLCQLTGLVALNGRLLISIWR